MTDHAIFVEAHWQNDNAVGLAVLCACGHLLWEDPGGDPQPQVSLDEINAVRWAHYDNDVAHTVPECAICGEDCA